MHYYKKKYLIVIALLVLTMFGSLFNLIYSKFQTSTKNAYIMTDIIKIQSKLNQKVKHIHVRNEQYVTLGSILLELEDQEYIDNITAIKASLFLAEKQLQLATANHEHSSLLFAAKRISKKEYNIAHKELEIATEKYADCQKLLNIAEEKLRHAKFYALNDGWVTNVNLTNYQEVKKNQNILELVNDKKFWVIATFNKKQLKYVRLKQNAKIQIKNVKDIEDYTFTGKVEEINDFNQKIYKVKILITNNDFGFPLRNGMKAKVTIYTNPFFKGKINFVNNKY